MALPCCAARTRVRSTRRDSEMRRLVLSLLVFVSASHPSAAVAQELRVAAAAANFVTNTLAVFASFTQVTKVYRVCATGGGIVTGTCAGAAAIGGRGALLDWVVIEGTLRDCGATCSTTNLGRSGGGFERVFITGGTGGTVLQSVSTTPIQLGFPAVFGYDGVQGNGDDPGAAPSTNGVPSGWPAASATPPINLGTLTRAALVQCNTGLKTTSDSLPVAVRPTWNVTPANELCIVDIDADGDGTIDNLFFGPPNPRTTIAGADGNETSNRRASADLGVSPIPPQDYADPTFNSL